MADEIKMSTLRVSSTFDASGYTEGANQQAAAQQKLVAGNKEVQVSFAQTDAKVSQAGDILARLSRQYVDGYAAQQRFEAGLAQLARGVERGAINMQQASKILDGMYAKFGLVADGAQFAARGQMELAQAVTEANQRMAAQQQLSAQNSNINPFRLDDMRSRFDQAFATARKMQAELNDLAELQREGIQITGGYEAAIERVTLKYDENAQAAARAAAATAAQAQAYREAAVAAREASEADRIQANIAFAQTVNQSGRSARESAGVFQAGFDESARLESLRLKYDQTAVSQAKMQAELAEINELQRAGIAIAGGYEAAQQAVILKYDQQAQAAARLRQEQAALAAAGREAFEADRIQSNLGFAQTVRHSGLRARDSARVFEEDDRRVTQFFNEALEAENRYAAGADRLRAELDPMAAAQERANREIAEYNQLLQRGLITQDEFTRGAQRAQQRAIIPGQGRNNQALGAFGAFNTGQQIQDIAVTAAMGQSIPTIALQQGLQLGTALEIQLENARRAGVGMGSALKSSFLGILSPINLAAIAVTALGAAAIQYFMNSEEDTRTLSQALSEQLEIVNKLGERYGLAAVNKDKYLQVSPEQQTLLAQGETRNLTEKLSTETQAVVDQIETELFQALSAGGGMPVDLPILKLQPAFDNLRKSVAAGHPDLTQFTQDLLAARDGSDAVQKLVEHFQGLAAEVTKANLQIEVTGDKLEDIAAKQRQLGLDRGAVPAQAGFAEISRPAGGAFSQEERLKQVNAQAAATAAAYRREIERTAETERSAARTTAEIAQMNALSVEQRVAAVKQLEEATFVKGEEEWQKALRVTSAVMKEQARGARELTEARTRLEQHRASERMAEGTVTSFQADRQRERDREDARIAAQIQAQNARTDAERIAAARRTAEVANPVRGEQREREINNAALQEQAAITREIRDSEDARARARARALEQAREEVALIGKSSVEITAAQIANEQIAQLKAEAAVHGREINAAEEASIRANAMQIAQLKEMAQIQASRRALEQHRAGERMAEGSVTSFEETKRREREREDAQIRANIQAMNARTDAERVAAARAEAGAANPVRGEQRNREMDNAGLMEQARINKELADSERALTQARKANIDSLQVEFDIIGKSVQEQTRLRIVHEQTAEALRVAEERRGKGAQLTEDEIRGINEYAAAYAKLTAEIEKTNAARERLFAREDLLAGARAELASVGATAGEAARLRTEFEGLQELQDKVRRGELSQADANKEAAAVRETARAYGEMTDAIAKAQLQADLRFEASIAGLNEENAAIARTLHSAGLEVDLSGPEAAMIRQINQIERMKETWQDLFDTVNSGMDGVVDALFEGTDPMEALKKSARDLARQMFDLAVTNPLKNLLTGGNFNTIGDMGIFGAGASTGRGGGFGGLLGGLFGLDKTVSSMSVQAATVIINGGIGGISGAGGLGSLLGGGAGDVVPGTSLKASDLVPQALSGAGSPFSNATAGAISTATGTAAFDDMLAYARQSALARGIDPNVALKVLRSEGLNPGVWQSNVINALGQRETSFGPGQLLVGGGLGDVFKSETGLNPADPSTWRQNIDFTLNKAAEGGWGPWYGAAKAGVGKWEGLRGARSLGITGAGANDDLSGGMGIDTLTTGSVRSRLDLAHNTALVQPGAVQGVVDSNLKEAFGPTQDTIASRIDGAFEGTQDTLKDSVTRLAGGEDGITDRISRGFGSETVDASESATDALSRLTDTSRMASESLHQAGLSGFSMVKGLTDASGGLSHFGSLLSSFMGAGGGAGTGWFQGLASMFGGAGGAINSMMNISPAATGSILAGGALGPMGLFHSGGIAGQATQFRVVDPSVFFGARRYHNGGIAGDEVPAILRRGEPVFRSMDHARQVVGNDNNQVLGQILQAIKGQRLTANVAVLDDPKKVGKYMRREEGRAALADAQRRNGTQRAFG